ncbi:B3 domain-containing protein [Forsythia ovata]|uniref:B3 domain-containing protein n=1 Tax=Forsythia ovata TaxID=205694 RepID=A0ABD1QLU7_9LAMI
MFGKTRDESENSEDFPSKNVGVAGCQGSFIDFKEFNITVNGFSVDSMVTENMRRKYYELCLARNTYLHHGLLKSINHIFATGIILETTTIADYIRGCKLSTSDDDFAMWDKRLNVLEVSGMNVGFLRSRLSYLVSLATKTRQIPESKRYAEAKLERGCMEQEIQSLKPRLRELKQATRKLEIEMDVLEAKIQIYERTFEEEANSPWSRDPRK